MDYENYAFSCNLSFNFHSTGLTFIYCMACKYSPLRRKFMKCTIINPALSLLVKHLVIGQRQRAPNFSAFHWSPHGSLVTIGQHFVTTRVVHLPERPETSLITKSDQSGPNHQLLQLCTACTTWSDLDQAVRAVHSCNSWLFASFNYLSNFSFSLSFLPNRLPFYPGVVFLSSINSLFFLPLLGDGPI